MSTVNELKTQYDDIPYELILMLNGVDAFTYNHSVRVCEMAQLVESELKLTGHSLSEAGLLHDIGKYYISGNILQKRGKLTKLERNFIDAHAFFSYDTLCRFGMPHEICEIALYHHTTTPYLFNVKLPVCEDQHIEYLARIIKTIDIYEAITSDRPYHRGLSEKTAAQCFEDDHIDHDPAVLEILMSNSKITRE